MEPTVARMMRALVDAVLALYDEPPTSGYEPLGDTAARLEAARQARARSAGGR